MGWWTGGRTKEGMLSSSLREGAHWNVGPVLQRKHGMNRGHLGRLGHVSETLGL